MTTPTPPLGCGPEGSLSKYADLLNDLEDMAGSIPDDVWRETLRKAGRKICQLERDLAAALEDRDSARDRVKSLVLDLSAAVGRYQRAEQRAEAAEERDTVSRDALDYLHGLTPERVAQLRAAERDAFTMAAGQCIVKSGGLMGDDHGHQYCDMERQRDELKQLAEAAERKAEEAARDAERYREHLRESAMAELPRLMSEISEKCYCAGWMSGTEFRLWRAIADEHDDGDWGRDVIETEEKERLARLSELVGGWFVWDDEAGDDNPQFIVMAEWQRRAAIAAKGEA